MNQNLQTTRTELEQLIPLKSLMTCVTREKIGNLLSEKKRLGNLFAEANIYYSDDTGIGFHGDTERKVVIGLNMGTSRTIEWQRFHRFLPVGPRFKETLRHGDMYFMTETGAGVNWKSSSQVTVRHRAGYPKWLSRDEVQNTKKWNKRINK